MCGRKACTLAPDDLVRACVYKDKSGRRQQPQWKDAPGGQTYKTSCNIAPTAHCPVLLAGCQLPDASSQRVLMPMKWGLTPAWHKDDPYKIPFETNNCRVEGMLEKKTYKVPLHKGQRCVVLMDGFFEWKTSKDGKQPYFFHFPQSEGFSFSKKEYLKLKTEVKPLVSDSSTEEPSNKRMKLESDVKEENIDSKDDRRVKCESSALHKHSDINNEENTPDCNHLTEEKSDLTDDSTELAETWTGQRLLTVAGVYDVWQSNPSSAPLYSYSVITVPASEDFSWCHHRMPAILATDEEVEQWLDTAAVPLKQAAALIRPTKCLSYYPVTKAMGNSRYNGQDCVHPISLSKPKPSASSSLMMNWLKKETVKKETSTNK